MKFRALLLSMGFMALVTFSNSQPLIKKLYVKQFKASDYFNPKLEKGTQLANIYSRTIAFSGNKFKPEVYRVSGTSHYEMVGDSAGKFIFKEIDLYDGRAESRGLAGISITGKGSYNGKEFENTSASGLLYNELIWGPVPKRIYEGYSWQINISRPWELGGPGLQTITVIRIDPLHATITLKREGNSEGFYDSDIRQLQITTENQEKKKVSLTPGYSHWVGYTIIKNGIILSDELLVTRPVTLTADDIKFDGQQREYILLNAMP